jgi:hypothetical protein
MTPEELLVEVPVLPDDEDDEEDDEDDVVDPPPAPADELDAVALPPPLPADAEKLPPQPCEAATRLETPKRSHAFIESSGIRGTR